MKNKNFTTGKHNPNFKAAFHLSNFIDNIDLKSNIEIQRKKDLIILLKTHTQEGFFDEESATNIEVSGKNGNDLVIEFMPIFNTKSSVNSDGMLEVDCGDTHIEIYSIEYTENYNDTVLISEDNYSDVELKEIRNILKTYCK